MAHTDLRHHTWPLNLRSHVLRAVNTVVGATFTRRVAGHAGSMDAACAASESIRRGTQLATRPSHGIMLLDPAFIRIGAVWAASPEASAASGWGFITAKLCRWTVSGGLQWIG